MYIHLIFFRSNTNIVPIDLLRCCSVMMVLVVEEQTVLLTVCNIFTSSVLKKIMMVLGLGGVPVLRKNLLAIQPAVAGDLPMISI